MASAVAISPLTRREVASYLFGAAFLMLLVALTGIVLWAMWPRPQVFDLGAAIEFHADEPTQRLVTLNSGKAVQIWVARQGEKFLAFDGRAGWGDYAYKWVPTNNRFEDPLSGYKWAITGELLTYFENPPFSQKAHLRDLDQYAAAVTDGHLWVNFNKVIRGTERTEPPSNLMCTAFMYTPNALVYNCAITRMP